MFKDNEKMLFLICNLCFFSYTLEQSARTVETVSTAVFVLILQTNIKKNQVRLTSCEKDKLCPAVQKWRQLEFTVANHQGATKVIELFSV